MHYIAGTKIIIKRQVVKPGITSATQIKRNDGMFKNDIVYALASIRCIDDKVEYRFTARKEEPVILKFDNTQAADQYISDILDHKVPDYERFYEQRD